jgi:hypothetical protein
MHFLVSRLSAEKHPVRFLLSLSSSGFTIASVKDGELLPIQSDSTFPKCTNIFAFKDMEKFVVRMGLRT